ncbi:MAG: hypothetical protein FWH46_03200 [Methanimicrococcus sp.]|nr:hypothetical protein [Methanimicrococcus sp.]
MSKKSFFSKYTKKQLYAFVLVGILISLTFLMLSYSVKLKIDSGQLTPEESDRQKLIFAFTIIGTTIGFVIAIVPCVKVFQRDIEILKSKERTKDPLPDSNPKKED